METRNLDVVLLHGLTGSSLSWGERIPGALRAAGFEPLLVDLPGHGGGPTEASAFTLEGALKGVLKRLGGGTTDVVGYSMGARLALALAVLHPERVRRLVLESGSPGLATEEERVARRAADETLAVELERDGIAAFVDRWEALPLFGGLELRVPPKELSALHARRLSNDPRQLAAALRGLGTGRLPSLWDELPRLDLPVLVLVGGRDGKFVEIAGRMAELLPRASVQIVPDTGHMVHLEQPARWIEAVVAFLSEEHA